MIKSLFFRPNIKDKTFNEYLVDVLNNLDVSYYDVQDNTVFAGSDKINLSINSKIGKIILYDYNHNEYVNYVINNLVLGDNFDENTPTVS